MPSNLSLEVLKYNVPGYSVSALGLLLSSPNGILNTGPSIIQFVFTITLLLTSNTVPILKLLSILTDPLTSNVKFGLLLHIPINPPSFIDTTISESSYIFTISLLPV